MMVLPMSEKRSGPQAIIEPLPLAVHAHCGTLILSPKKHALLLLSLEIT